MEKEIFELAGDIQDSLIHFVRVVNNTGAGCISRRIEVDGYMLLFYDKQTWEKFVDIFDILGMDFTTGEPDGKYQNWYIDFEFSDGVSRY